MKLNTFRPFKPFNRLAVSPSLSQQLASLFAKYPAAQGAWYDPSDLSTLFQDSAGTVPVTAVGQPVGLQRDKSGRGNHRHQPTTASRPILRQDSGGRYYLEADGVDDCLYTPGNVNFSGSDEVTICFGLQNSRITVTGAFLELSSSWVTNNGAFSVFAPGSAAENVFFTSKGTANANVLTALPVNTRATVTGRGKISTLTSLLRINGTQAANSAVSQGSGNYGSYPLYFFRRNNASNPFMGRDYGIAIIGKLLAGDELTTLEKWAAQKSGVTL